MQRDFDFVVTILGTICDAEVASLSAGEIRTNMQTTALKPLLIIWSYLLMRA